VELVYSLINHDTKLMIFHMGNTCLQSQAKQRMKLSLAKLKT